MPNVVWCVRVRVADDHFALSDFRSSYSALNEHSGHLPGARVALLTPQAGQSQESMDLAALQVISQQKAGVGNPLCEVLTPS